jgi:nicotinamide phosphoribosyltransferase
MKATYGEINGVGREIFKDPKTDGGEKKSAKGLLAVYPDDHGVLRLYDQCTPEQEAGGLLLPVYRDGRILHHQHFNEIRTRLWGAKF